MAAPSIRQCVAPARHDEAKTADKSGAAADRRATEDDSAAFETANSLDRAAVFMSCAVELISVAGAVRSATLVWFAWNANPPRQHPRLPAAGSAHEA